MDRLCIRAFIGLSKCVCMNVYVSTMFKKKLCVLPYEIVVELLGTYTLRPEI